MKKFGLFLLLIGLFSCTENKKILLPQNSSNAGELAHHIAAKSHAFGERLLAATTMHEADLKAETFIKSENGLLLHYNYPSLSTHNNPFWRSFNNFIEREYVANEDSVEKILKTEALSCDPLYKDAQRIKRTMDYKVYRNDQGLLSVLLFKTNYYDDQYHNSFMFRGLNYDLNKGRFMNYEDVFKEGSDEILLFKLNQELDARKVGQDSFDDCWKLTDNTFASVKKNFVISDTYVRFYFDDCTICPTYTGNHYFEIPLEELTHLMNSGNAKTMKEKVN